MFVVRWNGAYDPLAAELAQTPVEMADSTVHRLQGKFPFNGKVTDLYLYKDPYDTFMEDTLQTIYP